MVSEKEIAGLIRKTATRLPDDVAEALERALEREDSGVAREVLTRIIENSVKAAADGRPICQDTGTPIFYVRHKKDTDTAEIRRMIASATISATSEVPLRPNAIDTLSDRNMGNSPVVHFEEGGEFSMSLLMKGGGSENVSAIYKLPDESIGAQRDMDGVRRCVVDAVFRAQGKGCPPYFIGVATAGSIEEAAHMSKMLLLREVDEANERKELRRLETEILQDVNKLGIGPMGLGGRTTALSVKAAAGLRHPATYFVGVSIGCWCMRRGRLPRKQ